MDAFASHWAGHIYGTNTGNVSVKFDETEGELKGTLRILDHVYGVAVYNITGSKGPPVALHGVPAATVEGVALGDITASAIFGDKGELKGDWESSIGTGGTFVLFPHQTATPPQAANAVPEQIHTHRKVLGALSLYSDDIRALIAEMQRDFSNPRPVVTFSTGKGETTKFALDFESDLATVHRLTYLQIQVQEAESNGINKVVVAEFRRHGESEIRAQGSNESWVIGRVESLSTRLNRSRNWLVSSYKRFAQGVNHFIFYGMIVVIVGMSAWPMRAVFAFGVLLVLALFHWVHTALIPNTVLRLGGFKPNWLQRYWPSVVSWTFTIAGAVLASCIFFLIQKRLEPKKPTGATDVPAQHRPADSGSNPQHVREDVRKRPSRSGE